MGYHISQREAEFHIPVENFPKVVAAIKDAFNKKQIGWVRPNDVATDDIRQLFANIRWEVDIEDQAGITHIEFVGQKIGEDIDVLFSTIAPYVEAGSYIEMQGEGNEIWRYIFDGAIVRESYAKMTFSFDD